MPRVAGVFGLAGLRLRCARSSLCEVLPRSAALPLVQPRSIRNHSTSSSPIGDGTSSSSVSASEVSHFTQLASSWWDPHGPSRLLHLMNPLRHDFIQTCLRSSTATSVDKKYSYLDIGCGGGIFASSAARLPSTSSVTAIDPTPDVIKVAKAHQRRDPLLSQKGRLTYLNCAIEELNSDTDGKKELYDIVSVFEVIEHIDKPAAFLRQALAHLRPGGWLVGSTIARHPVSYFTTKIVAEAPWPIGVVPQGTHDWNKYVNPAEIRQWVEKESKDETIELSRDDASDGEVTGDKYGSVIIEGCIYLPLVGWKWVDKSADYGNYFFGVQKLR